MKRAVVVGSGGGGAAAAMELQGAYDVTVLEAGREFRRIRMKFSTLDKLKGLGLRLDAGWIPRLFPAMRIAKTEDMVLVYGRGFGGTTTFSTGNAIRLDANLKAMGIDLEREFEEIGREIPISTAHRERWGQTARRLYDVCGEMGLEPLITPKLGDYSHCRRCGRCILGCPYGVKWDSRAFLNAAQKKGARLVSGATVERVVLGDGRAKGVEVRTGLAPARIRPRRPRRGGRGRPGHAAGPRAVGNQGAAAVIRRPGPDPGRRMARGAPRY